MVQISIDINNVKVDEFYYTFNYTVYANGKKYFDNEEYQSDHVWGSTKKDRSDFKKHLLKYEAVNLVLEQLKIE